MLFTIYKIINNINNKQYIGAHRTVNVNDGYMGSGILIKRAIEKHGAENFSKEILFIFDSEEEMIEKERELVNEEYCKREDTYNLCVGGNGGFGYINDRGLSVRNFIPGPEVSRAANIRKRELLEADGEWADKYRLSLSLSIKNYYNERGSHWTGKNHSQETKERMSMVAKGRISGSKNPQFGKIWITDGHESTRIYKTDKIPDGWRAGRVIKNKRP